MSLCCCAFIGFVLDSHNVFVKISEAFFPTLLHYLRFCVKKNWCIVVISCEVVGGECLTKVM